MGKVCYWSVADGRHALMMQTLIASARAVGVTEDFHVWTDVAIPGAICHPCGDYDKKFYLFKLKFLYEEVAKLDYDHFVFIDADCYFVRNPGDVTRYCSNGIFVQMENEITSPLVKRPDWWGAPIADLIRFMRDMGVLHPKLYNTNAGFWIVGKPQIERFYRLAMAFWNSAQVRGFTQFTEEPPIAYAAHVMADHELMTLDCSDELWVSDWTGNYAGRLPDGKPWQFEDYLCGTKVDVNPAIVHAMRSKDAMVEVAGKVSLPEVRSHPPVVLPVSTIPVPPSSDIFNYFRMPTESCRFNRLPQQDYLNTGISDRETYLRICQFYDLFKMPRSVYQTTNWTPTIEEFRLNFGVHYPCYKQDRATYEALLAFRSHYPRVPIVLVSDNGHDFSDMAKFFGCRYIHATDQSGNGTTNVLQGKDKIDLWLKRIRGTCEILSDCEYILYMEDDLETRSVITKNPNAHLAGPSNPEDFWWSPQILEWMANNRPGVEINGLNGCGGTIFSRQAFLECINNQPDYLEMGKLDDRLTWASDVILTFLFMFNNKVSRRWLDHAEEVRGKNFGATAFNHQYKHFYDKKWSPYYLKNTELDANSNFIFTACSDNIVMDQFVPFIASLREHTSFNETLVIIDYGLSETTLKTFTENGLRIIPSLGQYEIVSDRFLSIARYIAYLNDPSKVFAHFDCDIWFNQDIASIFATARQAKRALCTKDVWHCGFLHDCVAKEEHKEYNRNILFEVERQCGKVLQAGFICGNTSFWTSFAGYLGKVLGNGYLKNVFGADELVLNLTQYYRKDSIKVLSIGYNTLPQWGIKDIDGQLVATDFHTDSHLDKVDGHTEPVLAVHLSSAARGKSEFAHTDFKVRHRDLYHKYLVKFGQSTAAMDRLTIVETFGFRSTMPILLDRLGAKRICEVGVQTGNNLFHMVHNSQVSEAWGVDLWKNTDNKAENDIGLSQQELDDLYANVLRISTQDQRIRIIRDYSANACKVFADGHFDYVYIDADHSFEGCRLDLDLWWPKVRSGGVFAGDDFTEATSGIGVRFGVIQAVTEFVAKHGLTSTFVNTAGKDNRGSSPQWFILKP